MAQQQQQQQPHPIFDDIYDEHMGAVQQRVLADAAVLEVRDTRRWTPLMSAIHTPEPAIALWLVEHRGQHDLEAVDDGGRTALHHATVHGTLGLVQALVAAGANPAVLDGDGRTALMMAISTHQSDVVAFLLRLPAVKAGIDVISQNGPYEGSWTALSLASASDQFSIVQLLDAGADPNIPPGRNAPMYRAFDDDNHALALYLLHVIAWAGCLRARVAWVGEKKGLCEALCLKVLGYMLPAWATKEPEVYVDSDESEEEDL